MAPPALSIKVLKRIGKLSSHGILVYNLDDKAIVYHNKRFGKLLGIPSPDGYDVKDLRQLIVEEDDFLVACFNKLKTKQELADVEIRTSNERYLCCDAYLLTDDGLIIVIAKDVTKAKKHSTYIVEFGARKDAILDMVSHNLSGPLNMTNNVLNIIDQLNEAKDYKAIDRHTRLVRENTQQCIEVINSFLKEEHLISEKVAIQTARFDVVDKIQILIDNIKPFNIDKTISLKTKVRELFVSADDVKFFQIVHNLVSNSVKFTKSNGTITIEVVDDESEFKVIVKDNGIGIPEYLHPHLFKRNTPASRAGLKGEKSIGMGLYIVKKLVALMQGSLEFESEENVGTRFVVTFPKNFD
jgi:two-component system, OmpR family, sensor histidine kinase VicK